MNNIFCRSWQELVKTSVEVDPTQKLSSSRFTPCTHRYEEHILYIYRHREKGIEFISIQLSSTFVSHACKLIYLESVALLLPHCENPKYPRKDVPHKTPEWFQGEAHPTTRHATGCLEVLKLSWVSPSSSALSWLSPSSSVHPHFKLGPLTIRLHKKVEQHTASQIHCGDPSLAKNSGNLEGDGHDSASVSNALHALCYPALDT